MSPKQEDTNTLQFTNKIDNRQSDPDKKKLMRCGNRFYFVAAKNDSKNPTRDFRGMDHRER